MSPKVLVIGSSDHWRASCFDWFQPFPNIEEYDSIILNMQTLTQDVYNKIYDRIFRLREPVTTVFTTNREIFCIMDKVLYSSVSVFKTGGPTYTYTSYDWIPIKIRINEKKGTSINLHDHRFDKYFEFVESWDYELDLYYGDNWADFFRSIFCQVRPIALNLSRRTIAGSIRRVNPLTGQSFDGNERGAIHLLPRTTKCDSTQAVEILLDIVCGRQVRISPFWRKAIEVPGTNGLELKRMEKIQGIQKIQQKISQIDNQMQRLDSYRDLLSETGDNLVNIVKEVLSDLGIKTEKTSKDSHVDLISRKVAVEVTGIADCLRLSSNKTIQTAVFKDRHHKGEKIILVANTYMHLPPKDRKGKMSFSNDIKAFLESSSICCLSTMTLYELWKEVIGGKRRKYEVRDKLLSKNGELTLDDFK